MNHSERHIAQREGSQQIQVLEVKEERAADLVLPRVGQQRALSAAGGSEALQVVVAQFPSPATATRRVAAVSARKAREMVAPA